MEGKGLKKKEIKLAMWDGRTQLEPAEWDEGAEFRSEGGTNDVGQWSPDKTTTKCKGEKKESHKKEVPLSEMKTEQTTKDDVRRFRDEDRTDHRGLK